MTNGYAAIRNDPTLSPAQREAKIEAKRAHAREWQREKRIRDRVAREAGVEPADAEAKRAARRAYNAVYRAKHKDRLREMERARDRSARSNGVKMRKHRPTGPEAVAAEAARALSARERAAEDARLDRQLAELHAKHRERQDVRSKMERLMLDERVGVIATAVADHQLRALAQREKILTLEVRALRASVGLPEELDAERRADRPNGGGATGSSIMRRAAARHYKTSGLTTGDKRVDQNKNYKGA